MRKASGVLTFITGLALLVFAASSPAAATGGGTSPNGFNGDVKIHEEPGEAEPIKRNEPHVCNFHIHGFNFDAQATGWWRIDGWAPDPGKSTGTVMAENWGPADEKGDWRTHSMTLPDGHYKLFWDQTTPQAPGGQKHKVFWVECNAGSTTGGSTTTGSTGTTTGTSTTTGTTTAGSTSTSTTGTAGSTTGTTTAGSTGTSSSTSTTTAGSTSTSGTSGTSSTTGTSGSTGTTATSGTSTTTTTGGTSGTTTGTTTAGASLGVETLPSTSGGGMQVGGGAVAGVQTLPSTSTDSGNGQFPFAYLGIALMASGAVMLIRQKPQKPFTQ